MTDSELLDLYDEIAEYVDDEILDEADELFAIDSDTPGALIPDEYYIFIAKKHLELHEKLADEAVESTFKIVTDVNSLSWS